MDREIFTTRGNDMKKRYPCVTFHLYFFVFTMRKYVMSLLTNLSFFSFVLAFCWYGDYFRINTITLLEKLVQPLYIVSITILVFRFYGILYIYSPLSLHTTTTWVCPRSIKYRHTKQTSWEIIVTWWSAICFVLYYRFFYLASFFDFDIWFWNCSEGVVFFVCFFYFITDLTINRRPSIINVRGNRRDNQEYTIQKHW
jgi:hypothetical protein